MAYTGNTIQGLVTTLTGAEAIGNRYGVKGPATGVLLGLEGHVVEIVSPLFGTNGFLDLGLGFDGVFNLSDQREYVNIDKAGNWRGIIGPWSASYRSANGTAPGGTRLGRLEITGVQSGGWPALNEEYRITSVEWAMHAQNVGFYDTSIMVSGFATYTYGIPFTTTAANERYRSTAIGTLITPLLTIVGAATTTEELLVGWENGAGSANNLRNQNHFVQLNGYHLLVP